MLNKQDIIFEIKDNHLSWYNLNLQLFDLFFCKDIGEIVVTVQWLESVKSNPNSKLFLFSTKIASTKSFFYREKSMAKWINYKSKPSFYLTL